MPKKNKIADKGGFCQLKLLKQFEKNLNLCQKGILHYMEMAESETKKRMGLEMAVQSLYRKYESEANKVVGLERAMKQLWSKYEQEVKNRSSFVLGLEEDILKLKQRIDNPRRHAGGGSSAIGVGPEAEKIGTGGAQEATEAREGGKVTENSCGTTTPRQEPVAGPSKDKEKVLTESTNRDRSRPAEQHGRGLELNRGNNSDEMCGTKARPTPQEPVAGSSRENINPYSTRPAEQVERRSMPMYSDAKKRHGRCRQLTRNPRHKTMGPHRCICGFSCSTEHTLRRHIIEGLFVNVFKCREDNCRGSFANVRLLKYHATMLHGVEYFTDFGCAMCGELFMQDVELQKHFNVCPQKKIVDDLMKMK